ncbi:hypothetical protein BKA67DRAFT_557204 [Truncatella angustata]|uniref:Uncharacterized protein n=1 Tax=Truncatella angustata TaxID=152316 RepID=A0A9P8USA4_9PEZI|nr:uncharacterized protein BKA67DRAFT_557204 [Truncatella angustata]KAH6658120.1 hypothetical protein BKA67DRAFT_557204 [Truncatella angustata]
MAMYQNKPNSIEYTDLVAALNQVTWDPNGIFEFSPSVCVCQTTLEAINTQKWRFVTVICKANLV